MLSLVINMDISCIRIRNEDVMACCACLHLVLVLELKDNASMLQIGSLPCDTWPGFMKTRLKGLVYDVPACECIRVRTLHTTLTRKTNISAVFPR